jgi:glycosyltransferase involved in cell wall biosynthesis
MSLYIPISGGLGQILDSLFALLAILRGVRVYAHHHSFAYLNRSTWYSKWLFLILGQSNHIVLCGHMKALLARHYSVCSEKIIELSNAAFLEPLNTPPRNVFDDRPFTIGFLSNITAEKGVFTFLALAHRLQCVGLPVAALIGGPIASGIETEFLSSLKTLENAEYIGAIYGEEKTNFFDRLDVFVFPSVYQNEAEPVVVWEAMRAGIPTLATRRGCIGQMLGTLAGAVTPEGTSFEDFAFEWLRNFLRNEPSVRLAARKRAIDNFALNRSTAMVALFATLTEIAG